MVMGGRGGRGRTVPCPGESAMLKVEVGRWQSRRSTAARAAQSGAQCLNVVQSFPCRQQTRKSQPECSVVNQRGLKPSTEECRKERRNQIIHLSWGRVSALGGSVWRHTSAHAVRGAHVSTSSPSNGETRAVRSRAGVLNQTRATFTCRHCPVLNRGRSN